jgi:DNA repair protein RecO (recombination protein O)
MLTKDNAICIRALDYSETSQIVTFFARGNGKFSAIAKGSKRPKSPFDGTIEPLALGQIVFIPKPKLATLTEFAQEPAFTGLGSDLFVLNCCLFAAELLNLLTDDYDPHPELFDSFVQFLSDLQQTEPCEHRKKAVLALLILFQLGLLKDIGLQPILGSCVNCKSKYRSWPQTQNWLQAYFSSQANGLVCRDCEANFPDKIRVSKNSAGCLADFKIFAGAGEKILNEVEKVLAYHFTKLLHRPLKMAKHVIIN